MAIYKGINSPPRKVIQNGKFANDGTGDTLRDAADKINDNFKQLWYNLYVPEDKHPGREFRLSDINTSIDSVVSNPDSGQFVSNFASLASDSDQAILKISAHDTSGKVFKFISSDTLTTSLSVWQWDSDNYDEFQLVAMVPGTATYNDSYEYWRFEKTGSSATSGVLVESDNYFFSLQGIW